MNSSSNVSAKDSKVRNDLKMLPPVEVGRWRLYERLGLHIRDFAGVSLTARLNPFDLARSLNLRVMYPSDLEGLSISTRAYLEVSGVWSGGATGDLGDGTHIVMLNQKHSSGRQAATLMEEICHILFGHKPSGIDLDQLGGRSYNFSIEEEAYAAGAAALVPYYSLKSFLTSGLSIRKIAAHFGVTPSLIVYRTKGLRLQKYIP